MLALYIKGIEEVLWYICIRGTTHNLEKVKKKEKRFLFFKIITHTVNGQNIYLCSCRYMSTSFVYVEDVLR